MIRTNDKKLIQFALVRAFLHQGTLKNLFNSFIIDFHLEILYVVFKKIQLILRFNYKTKGVIISYSFIVLVFIVEVRND